MAYLPGASARLVGVINLPNKKIRIREIGDPHRVNVSDGNCSDVARAISVIAQDIRFCVED